MHLSGGVSWFDLGKSFYRSVPYSALGSLHVLRRLEWSSADGGIGCCSHELGLADAVKTRSKWCQLRFRAYPFG